MSDFQVRVGAKVTDDIQQQLDAMKKKSITVTPILDKKGIETGTKTVTEFIDKEGKLIQVTDKYNKVADETKSTVTKQKQAYKDTSKAVDENSKTLKSNVDTMNKATYSSKKLGQGILDISTKVAKFYVITKAIQTVQQAMASAVEVVKDYDKAFTEASKVSDMSADGLEAYAQRLGELGQETARTRTEMLQGATEFLKSGYNEDESAILARSAS